MDLFRLHNRLKADPECFQRDDERLFYEAHVELGSSFDGRPRRTCVRP